MLIVTYHAIAGPPSPVCSTPTQFEADLTAMAEAGFTFVSLDDCADWLVGLKTLPVWSVAVTFDDAYASVVSHGLPTLTRLGIPATVFVIGGRVGGDNQWPGQWRSIPPMRLADVAELRALVEAGISIGSHSWSHAVLCDLEPTRLQAEIETSADRLEQLLQVPVRHFAYPYGFRGAREIAAVRARYRTAVNAEPRLVHRTSDPHDLCRVDCHDVRLALRFNCLAAHRLGPYLSTRRHMRRTRRRLERILGL
jgi:peptidoglycan/xylan/chitin deacetylase (PgdA/CDA1 family)